MMRGASVSEPGATPQYRDLVEPEPAAGEVVVRVEAAALSNLVRSQASGQHYSSGSEYPFTPGYDGVGIRDDGKRVYFVAPRSPFGSMADSSVVRRDQTIELPDTMRASTAAAMGNPGLATWGALLGRAGFKAGEVVLVNGATGVTGRAAVRVATKLGAARVIATGRDSASLDELRAGGADRIQSVSLSPEELEKQFRRILAEERVDIVLDYLWGESAGCLLRAASGHGSAEKAKRIRYVQIGAISGAEIMFPASVLRSSGLELLGSGLGSLGISEIIHHLGEMYRLWIPSDSDVEIVEEPLRGVASAWHQDTGGKRLVLLP